MNCFPFYLYGPLRLLISKVSYDHIKEGSLFSNVPNKNCENLGYQLLGYPQTSGRQPPIGWTANQKHLKYTLASLITSNACKGFIPKT